MKKFLLILAALLPASAASVSVAADAVILLHGLVRSDRSMKKMESALQKEGYTVLNVDYPSRSANIKNLADKVLSEALEDPALKNANNIHFVTHSLGGILVRQYLQDHTISRLGRVVMLGPPNQGSEVVDKLGNLEIFQKMHGPSGNQLGTNTNSVPKQLGPVTFELGIIAGDRSINWINSLAMIKGADDGKVSVAHTKVAGMKDHITIHATHPYLMRNTKSIRQTIHFLKNGNFIHSQQTSDLGND